MYGQTHGWKNTWMDEHMDRKTHGWTNTWMNKHIDGQTHKQMNALTNKHRENQCCRSGSGLYRPPRSGYSKQPDMDAILSPQK